jgi:hypothetical protein
MFMIYAALAVNAVFGAVHALAWILGREESAQSMQFPAISMLICLCAIEIVREIRKAKGS